MTFEELQINLNLVFDKDDKMKILDTVAKNCDEGYFFVDDEGECYLFDENGDLDDIKKIKTLCEKHIKKDIKKIKIPKGIINIWWDAFFDCKSLTNVTIPNSVKNIGFETFWGCNSMTSVTIPNSVTNIGDGAFYYCSSLMNIVIQNSVIIIGYAAFEDCRGLTSITIPDSVASIGFNAFWSCKNLKELVFKRKTLDEVKSMDNYPFGLEDESIIKVE